MKSLGLKIIGTKYTPSMIIPAITKKDTLVSGGSLGTYIYLSSSHTRTSGAIPLLIRK